MQPLINSDGSAKYQLGNARVVCSVNGPLEVKARDELPTQATLEVVVRPNIGLPSIKEALMQDELHLCLESIILRQAMPRQLIQIVVQILESSQPVTNLAATVNVSSLALANAAVPLDGLCVAVPSAYIDNELVVSPSDYSKATSTHVVTFKFSNGPDAESRVVHAKSTGNFTKNEFIEVLELSQEAAQPVYVEMRESIEATFKESTKWR